MKTKRFEKKLSLKKETVMDLNQMVIAKGGAIVAPTTYTCFIITCNTCYELTCGTCDTDCYCSDYVTACGSKPCC